MTSAFDNPPELRAIRTRRTILQAAEVTFLEHGYLGASMDAIAAAARVSKQTVYRHFADKERLFLELVTTVVNEVSDPVADEITGLRESANVDDDLRRLAYRLLERGMDPRLLALRRLVIGESGRFPELGRVFYDRGPGRTISTLTTLFERLASTGALVLPDPGLAATQFNWLVMSGPLNRAMLLGFSDRPSAAELDVLADVAATIFLAAYRPAQPFRASKGVTPQR